MTAERCQCPGDWWQQGPPSVAGVVLLSSGVGGIGQEVAGKETSESKEQGNLWASVCKRAVSTMLIHFGWMRSIYYMSGGVWWMGSQVFPRIISALWSVGDLFSSIYGVTSLKPKGKFIQPFPAFLFFPFLFYYISAFFFFFFSFFSFPSGLKSSLLFG